MTAVNWMIDELIKKHIGKVGNEYVEIFEQAKQIEKQQIIDAYYGYELYLDREFRFQQGGQAKILTFDHWYETYGSKGSDETLKENHIVDTNEMISSQTEISDDEIEKWVASTPYYGHCTPEY